MEKCCPEEGVGEDTTHEIVFPFSLLPRSAAPYLCILQVMRRGTRIGWILWAFMHAKSWTRLWPPVPGIRELTYLALVPWASLRQQCLSEPPWFHWILTPLKRRAQPAILLHPQSKHSSALPGLLRNAEHSGPTMCDGYNGAARAKSNLWLYVRRKQIPLDLQHWTSALYLGVILRLEA